ncbi:hypothetical protein H696_02002 [Fonticula alba]|uniref:Clathrin light chain n=1 Tax=Fonticula alba TaxID=691883 RepID=A0A058ZC87_FONAL|nr:hypothetical protein H696_02002 [Fonticula alba]KCV71052.1 hypothetical protein H696_02002 [Fonticula alba]|eukprot:XP_009494175.1 hypothetical protein H696_02002 [Fonticula alba]
MLGEDMSFEPSSEDAPAAAAPTESFAAADVEDDEADFFANSSVPMSVETASPSFSSPSAPGTPAAIPEAIAKWRAERDAKIEAQEAEARTQAAEMRKEAAAALEKWRSERNAKIANAARANRDAESALKAKESPSGATDVNPWVRVADNVDLTTKGQRSTKDVSRMRSVMVQLKTNAPVRSGVNV